MHEITTLEGEDPRLTKMMCLMRPAKPRYGLGQLEQANDLFPACRFDPVPDDCKKPAVMEMHKFFSLMDGCFKFEISEKWMREMLNWDLFTNPQAKEFDHTYSPQAKKTLAEEWKHYMEVNNSWISFYSWEDNIAPINVLTGSSSTTSVNKHAWTALDGNKVETPSTFPPFKGIVIGGNKNVAKSTPMVQKDDNALGIDGRIEKASS